VKEELDNDPDFFHDYTASKGKGGPTAPEAQAQPAIVSA